MLNFPADINLRTKLHDRRTANVLSKNSHYSNVRNVNLILIGNSSESNVGYLARTQNIEAWIRNWLSLVEVSFFGPDSDCDNSSYFFTSLGQAGNFLPLEFNACGFRVSLGDLANKHVRLTEEFGHEGGLRSVIQDLRCTKLLDVSLIHNRDGIGHVHGFFLVVSNVQESKPDFHLDSL